MTYTTWKNLVALCGSPCCSSLFTYKSQCYIHISSPTSERDMSYKSIVGLYGRQYDRFTLTENSRELVFLSRELSYEGSLYPNSPLQPKLNVNPLIYTQHYLAVRRNII